MTAAAYHQRQPAPSCNRCGNRTRPECHGGCWRKSADGEPGREGQCQVRGKAGISRLRKAKVAMEVQKVLKGLQKTGGVHDRTAVFFFGTPKNPGTPDDFETRSGQLIRSINARHPSSSHQRNDGPHRWTRLLAASSGPHKGAVRLLSLPSDDDAEAVQPV
jgi:hypothetical protein